MVEYNTVDRYKNAMRTQMNELLSEKAYKEDGIHERLLKM